MATKFQCELVSWGRIVNLTRKLALLIKQDAYIPDIIIAIGRGGYVPARLLADYLDIMNLTSIKIEHYTAGTCRQDIARVKYPLSIDVSQHSILVVDDVSDTGDTFNVALSHIRQHSSPKEIRTAVLHHKTVSRFTPDYYATRVIKWRWITYPWAQCEDIGHFIMSMDPQPVTLDDITEQLFVEYGVRISRKLVKDVITMMDGA